MAKMVAQMSVDELRELVGDVVEEKLLEMLRDPDKGLTLQPAMRERLERQRRQVETFQDMRAASSATAEIQSAVDEAERDLTSGLWGEHAEVERKLRSWAAGGHQEAPPER